jgi:hypothetical protein
MPTCSALSWQLTKRVAGNVPTILTRNRPVLAAVAAAFVTIVLTGTADATRRPTRRELRGIKAVVLPSNQSYFRCGRIAWASVSTAGPYALASTVARSARACRHSFQDVLLLVGRRRDGRWRFVADVINENCPRVPRRVLRDFHGDLARRRLIHPGTALARDCIGRIARAAS